MEAKSKTQGKDTAHSPLPWKFSEISGPFPAYSLLWADTSKGGVWNRRIDEKGIFSAADAALIVRAVNQSPAFDALVAALDKCDTAFVSWQVGQIPGRPEDILALITDVRAALALARQSRVE